MVDEGRLLLSVLGMIGLLLGSCSPVSPIKDGVTAFERKQYFSAIPLLKRDFERARGRSDKGRLAYRIAESYRNIGDYASAHQWYGIAYQYNYGPEALKGQAHMLKRLERYAEAKEAFRNLSIEIGSPYEYRKEMAACEIAIGWLASAKESGWSVQPVAFNSPQNDFSPAFYTEGRLVFSSDRPGANSKKNYGWTGNKFMDLFVAAPDAYGAQPFDVRINSTGNEGSIAFNRLFTEVYFSRAVGAYKGDDQYCKLYVSTRTEDGWSEPSPLPYQKERINYMHPALSPDGQTLLFACNDPEGWGGYDLWMMRRNPQLEGGWEEPKVLSRNVNTPGNELFPTWCADTVFFASDGHPGMGGLDIFRTYKMADNTWATPQNLKPPINSGADDFGLIALVHKPQHRPPQPGDLLLSGFFTSNRPGGRGGDDIYYFEQRVPPPKPPKTDTTVATPTKPIISFKILLEGYVLEKILADPTDPNSRVLGRKPLPGARVDVAFRDKNQLITVDDNGFFRLELAENTDYTFTAAKEGYLTNNLRFSTRGIPRDSANPVQIFEVEIVLDKIFRNREIVLENIYYDFDKWDIRPDAEPTLNRLAEMLQQNPGIRIQLGSHTDCRGDNAYNQTLSQRRAQSAVNYLIARGIDPARLTAVGYGETQPAVNCPCNRCTEAEHQANRRTTFKILD